MDDVAIFVRCNANKALMNLGYPARFTAAETEVNPKILSALAPATTTGCSRRKQYDFVGSRCVLL